MRGLTGVASLLAALSIAPAAYAVDYVVTFDDLAADSAVGTVGRVTFSHPTLVPTVFNPSVATWSEPHALHPSEPCSLECANQAYKLHAAFDAGATEVQVRVGSNDGTFEFPLYVRMLGYSGAQPETGAVVADSGDQEVSPGGTSAPIYTRLSVLDPSARIRSVTLYAGRGTRSHDGLAVRRPEIDNFLFRIPQAGQDPPPSDPPPADAGPPPTVEIGRPSELEFFPRQEQVSVSGRVVTSERLVAFCVTANRTEMPPVPECNQIGSLGAGASGGGFAGIGVRGLNPGRNTLNAWVRDIHGRQARFDKVIELAGPEGNLDLRTTAMEITQGIQSLAIPINRGAPIAYRGADLIRGGRTIVRVFANAARLGRFDRPATHVTARLYGEIRRDGRFPESLGPPLVPESGDRTLTLGSGETVPIDERADPEASYFFALPRSWTERSERITLRAIVNPGDSARPIPECARCLGNNALTVTDVDFQPSPDVDLAPLRITYLDPVTGAARTPRAPERVFAETRNITAVDDTRFRVRPYVGTVDVTDIGLRTESLPDNAPDMRRSNERNDRIFDRVAQFEEHHNPEGKIVGVHDGLARGREAPVAYAWPPRVEDVAHVNQNLPLISVGHEVYHQYHYFHAGRACPTDFPFVHWPPDDRGYLQGVGLDRRIGSGRRLGTYRILAPFSRGHRGAYYDLMSYCRADQSDYWISLRHWNGFGDALPSGVPLPDVTFGRRIAAVGPAQPRAVGEATLRVRAMVARDGSVSILRVGRGARDGRTTPSVENTPYRVQVRDATGAVVGSVGVEFGPTHLDGAPGATGGLIDAELAAPGAVAVDVLRGEEIVATRERSPRSPRVEVLLPRSGQRIPGRGRTLVQWRAEDPDGDDLETRLEYSAGKGSWRTIAITGAAGKMRLDNAHFAAARRGRLRATVSDGFSEASDVSAVFRAQGPPPTVRIAGPRRITLRADAQPGLVGEGYGSDGAPLARRALRWFDGRRRLARGATPSLAGRLRPGVHDLRLVARDGGRRARDRIRVRVLAVAPDLLEARWPKAVSSRARRVSVRLSSTVAAVLRIGGRRYALNRSPRRISLRVPRGAKPVRLRGWLIAGSKATPVRRTIPRR